MYCVYQWRGVLTWRHLPTRGWLEAETRWLCLVTSRSRDGTSYATAEIGSAHSPTARRLSVSNPVRRNRILFAAPIRGVARILFWGYKFSQIEGTTFQFCIQTCYVKIWQLNLRYLAILSNNTAGFQFHNTYILKKNTKYGRKSKQNKKTFLRTSFWGYNTNTLLCLRGYAPGTNLDHQYIRLFAITRICRILWIKFNSYRTKSAIKLLCVKTFGS